MFVGCKSHYKASPVSLVALPRPETPAGPGPLGFVAGSVVRRAGAGSGAVLLPGLVPSPAARREPGMTAPVHIYIAPDKNGIFISLMLISSLNPMFEYLLELSHRDNSNKC